MRHKTKKRERVGIVDGHAVLYRSFYAIPEMTAPDGTPTNAVYGCVRYSLNILRDEGCDRLIWVFDPGGVTEREKQYKDYKATRDPMPESLSAQVPLVKSIFRAMGLNTVEVEGIEADDVIATLARIFSRENNEVIIYSSDKDLCQLVDDSIKIAVRDKSSRGHIYLDREGVTARFGVSPSRIGDYLALVGDASDNIPGIKGIGTKTAVSLIEKYGSLEEIYNKITEVSPVSLRKKLESGKEMACLSRELVRLEENVKIGTVDRLPEDRGKQIELMGRLGFNSILKELGLTLDEGIKQQDIEYEKLESMDEIETAIKKIKGQKLCFFLAGTDTHPIRSQLDVLVCATSSGKVFILKRKVGDDLFEKGLGESELVNFFKRSLDSGTKSVVFNSKWATGLLLKKGIEVPEWEGDIMLKGYLLKSGEGHYKVSRMAADYLGRLGIREYEPSTPGDESDLILARIGDCLFPLNEFLDGKLKEEQLENLYREVEQPLAKVLAEMEMAGIKVDASRMEKQSEEFAEELEDLTEKIYETAGAEFNINSTKQLAEVLFEKMGIKPVKKTKTGFSTNSDVLKVLSVNHPIASLLLRYRQIAKLKSTYLDTFPKLIDDRTGRIHSVFNQTGTITGRISSQDPNLQNIPIRTPEGERIRDAFIAEPGFRLLSADYSQIELRIFAHFSGSKPLLEAFRNQRDVHAETASLVFDVPIEQVTHDQRRMAKTINFGILYGMSAFSLGNDLGISRKQAQEFIEKYFDRMAGVKEFIEETRDRAKKRGYVETLTGRRRYMPELESRNPNVRSFGERAAVNMPIQGTAADIIKIAMIRIRDKISTVSGSARMILQIHDELLFEVPENETDRVRDFVIKEMESVWSLDVPLGVDAGVGDTWREAH